MKNLAWIYAALHDRNGYFASYPVVRSLVTSAPLIADDPVAVQVAQAMVAGARLDAVVSSCVGAEVGLWFHAGWHDQASLDILECQQGASQRTARLFGNLDTLQPHQHGDMVAGFASIESDWVLLVMASRERRSFGCEIRAASDVVADEVCGRLAQLPTEPI